MGWRAKYLTEGAKVTICAEIYSVGAGGVLDPQPVGAAAEHLRGHPSFVGPALTPKPPQASPSPKPAAAAPDVLGELSYKELRALAKELGVKGKKGMTRDDYEAAVRAAQETD
jgi:hypothetical protein